MGDAFVERFGDLLADPGLTELFFVPGIAEEADFGEDAGHVGTDQDHERGAFDAAITDVGGGVVPAFVECAVDAGGELAGLVNFVFEGDFLEKIAEFEDAAFGCSVFAGGGFESRFRGGEAEEKGLDAGDGLEGRTIGVDGEKQVGLAIVGHFGSLLERDETIVLAGENDFGTEAVFEERAEAEADIEDHLFFREAGGAGCSVIVAAVAGVEDDTANFESEGAGEGGDGGIGRGGGARGA